MTLPAVRPDNKVASVKATTLFIRSPVGDGENAWRDAQAKHLGRPEVDHEPKFWLAAQTADRPCSRRCGRPGPYTSRSEIIGRPV